MNNVKNYFFLEKRVVFTVKDMDLLVALNYLKHEGLLDEWHTELGTMDGELKGFIALSKDESQLPSGENG